MSEERVPVIWSNRKLINDRPSEVYPTGEWMYTTIISPKTGRKFGVIISHQCGELHVTAPTFAWPAIKGIMNGEKLDSLSVTSLVKVQDMVNERCLTS
jgi:hypothetical protein